MKRDLQGNPLRIVKFVLLAILTVGVIIGVAGILMLRVNPSVGAYGAEYVRRILGNKAVVVMETALFQTEDLLKNVEYKLGLAKAENPFGSSSVPAVLKSPGVKTPLTQKSQLGSSQNNLTATPPVGGKPGLTSSVPAGLANKTVTTWLPEPVDALGSQPGSGEWQPYLQDASGQVIAYRTFIQPDPSRPYAYTAIVAFDLERIHLHYVPGTMDPYAPGIKKRAAGVISPSDLQNGLLLAAFNGGFKYEHGHFGSMADNFITAPPLDGMGTVVIDQNGRVGMSEWGKDFTSGDNLLAFRQNGPLVIQNGEISPRVDDSLIWGETITGGTVTMRSGMATSADGRTLYYFAGPSLTVRFLAKAMLAAHVQTGIQLDINNFWVHFTSFIDDKGNWAAKPLLAKVMAGDVNRFLRPYPRDFFYITALP